MFCFKGYDTMGIYAMQIIVFQDNRNIRISGSNLNIPSLRQEHMNKVSKELEESETSLKSRNANPLLSCQC